MSERRSRLIEHDDEKLIVLEYYDGAYGKTLRIDTQSVESLEALARLFGDLSQEGNSEASLRNLSDAVFVPPLVDVKLGRSRALDIRVKRKSEGEAVCLIWSQPARDWEDATELVKQLAQPERGNVPGHHYLTSSDAGVLVELAFGE